MINLANGPRIVRRFCGGYLAISTSSDGPRIGVAADTEGEARERLSATLKRWLEILDEATEPACHAQATCLNDLPVSRG
jgi:hypothetical protein